MHTHARTPDMLSVEEAREKILALVPVLEGSIVNQDGARVYARAIIAKRNGTYYPRPRGPQGFNILTSTATTNGLAIYPEDVPVIQKGQRVQVRMLDWDEEGVYQLFPKPLLYLPPDGRKSNGKCWLTGAMIWHKGRNTVSVRVLSAGGIA